MKGFIPVVRLAKLPPADLCQNLSNPLGAQFGKAEDSTRTDRDHPWLMKADVRIWTGPDA